MIDEEMTVRMFGYTSDMLSSSSNKKIVVMCEACGVYRILRKGSYRNLCISCSQKGKTHSKETRQKLSDATKGKNNPNYGKHHTEETRQKISDANRNPSEETRQKLSDARKNRAPISEETRQKMSDANRNPSEETRQKIGDAQKGKIASEETRQKLSDAGKNRAPISEETRQKISAAGQGISYDEWESFAKEQLYCPKFDESCRESNREKYDRRCFICGKPESENITSTGKFKRLSVHHVDRNKDQGCNGHDWALVPTCLEHHAPAHSELWTARIVYLLNHVWQFLNIDEL